MMKVLQQAPCPDGSLMFSFHCEKCNTIHSFFEYSKNPEDEIHSWNHDMEKPTVVGEILNKDCRLWILDGHLVYQDGIKITKILMRKIGL